MLKDYKEIRGVLIKKYRNILGQCIFVLEENDKKARIRVGEMSYLNAELNTKWTIGYIGRRLINIRPGLCKNTNE